MALQETKLFAPSFKIRSFLPSHLSEHQLVNAAGTSGGLITAWDPKALALDDVEAKHILIVKLTILASGISVVITNVYAPAAHDAKAAFLARLELARQPASISWLLYGISTSLAPPLTKTTAISPSQKPPSSTT